MKGFLSFLLLFSIVLILIAVYTQISLIHFDKTSLITIERIYSLEMNLKQLVNLGSKEGAKEGLLVYSATANKFESEDAETMMKVHIINKLSLVNSIHYDDFSFILWCGNPSDYDLILIRKKMLDENSLLSCTNCISASEYSCTDFIDIIPIEYSTDSISSFKIKIGNNKGIFGGSIYSEKFKISSAFPITEEVMVIG